VVSLQQSGWIGEPVSTAGVISDGMLSPRPPSDPAIASTTTSAAVSPADVDAAAAMSITNHASSYSNDVAAVPRQAVQPAAPRKNHACCALILLLLSSCFVTMLMLQVCQRFPSCTSA